jgi:N-acetylneuraminic acid mutarotase
LNGDVTAGDKVYTLQFGVNDASPAKHYYAVSYKSISSGSTYSTEVDSTTSVPIISVSDTSSYSQNIQDSINRLVNATTSYQAIYPTSATAINQTALDNYTSAMVSVMGNIQQLSSYDTANPLAVHARMGGLNSAIKPMGGGLSNFFWSLIPFGLGDIMKKNNELAPEKAAFLSPSFNPNDPAVAGVMTWLAKNPVYESGCIPDMADDAGCRADIWMDHYVESPEAGLLEAVASTAESAAVSEYTGLAETGEGELLSNETDLTPLAQWAIGKGVGIATDYFVDNFTASSGRQMLVLGSVSQGQTTMLPNGSHDIILASSSTRTETPGVASPAISTLAPASLAVGATPQTLTVKGTGFLSSSTVTFNGLSHAATFVSSTQLTISLTSADLATVGSYPVVVTNPAPGGGTSAAASFTVASDQAAGQWTWMGGSNTAGATDVFGTEGVPDPANVPGSRTAANSWTDNSGNFWLFGGIKHNSGYGNGENDLWEFSPSSNEWTWVSGNHAGVYGTLGVPDASNLLPGRSSASDWIDSNGKLWLYGGNDFNDTDSNSFYFNDLWNYDPTTKVWTWVSGTNSICDCGVSGTQGIPDTANVPLSRQGAISWIDSSGNLWLFGGSGRTAYYWYTQFNDLWKYKPVTNEWTWVSGTNPIPGQGDVVGGVYGTRGVPAVDNVPGARSDAVSWKDSSGNFWFFGGDFGSYYVPFGSLNDLWEFNPTSGLWTWVSGANIANQPGFYNTLGVPAVDNVPGARSYAVSWTDSSGNFWLFGGYGYDSAGVRESLNDLWMFNPISKMWTCVKGNTTDISTGQVLGIYGTLGIPAAANSPGGRSSAVSWVDKNGALWLFGGEGYDSTGKLGILNDLWRYQP